MLDLNIKRREEPSLEMLNKWYSLQQQIRELKVLSPYSVSLLLPKELFVMTASPTTVPAQSLVSS